MLYQPRGLQEECQGDALPHRKSNPKDPLPHFENVTQIKADYPGIIAPGGQYGVIHAREKSGYSPDPFPLPKSKTERKIRYPEPFPIPLKTARGG
jgi:hypothetical protein